MTQNEKSWLLPYEKYSLMYFTSATQNSIFKQAIQVARENPNENFIVFGRDISDAHGAPTNIHFAGLVEPSRFLYALRRAKTYLGTLGLGPIHEAYRLNIPMYVLPMHAEQRANIRFCPNAVVLKSILEYSKKKGTWIPVSNKVTSQSDSASFVANKIAAYLENR